MSPLSDRVHAANTLFTAANDDAIGDHFSPDYVAHVTDRRLAGGHALVRHQLALYRTAFSDLRLEVEVLVEADDRIAWQRTLRAVHSGPFLGFPATGAELVWRDVVTSRIAAGLIVEEWVITDLVERLVLARKRPAARAR
jgi:predicted ester cyclase